MNLFGKISILIWLIIFIAAAIMFDWFGSREIATKVLDSSQTAVEKLSETGDHVQDAIDVVNESTAPVREDIKEKAAE
ncbi:hypothetical protein THMIRHAM_01290 [Thiomicrorhabdus immobilis]|uniref:Uncharacterized protein n=1 Tax=Thiomicrorhabdus immobilis TaxID=2791037 RepID=A0ABM7MAG8_9GAMM|nr:hypothetical protein [Thiomicrorhabdus immobilis]BCN92344.1 hypothetical protein THMIRHAM_01290 [Thiomicrorhabdus immobilis]